MEDTGDGEDRRDDRDHRYHAGRAAPEAGPDEDLHELREDQRRRGPPSCGFERALVGAAPAPSGPPEGGVGGGRKDTGGGETRRDDRDHRYHAGRAAPEAGPDEDLHELREDQRRPRPRPEPVEL